MRIKHDLRFVYDQQPPPVEPPPQNKYVGFRGLHWAEGGRVIPALMPEVIPPIDTFALPMTEAIQRMSFALIVKKNNAIIDSIWRKLHTFDRCLNNGAQNGYDGGIPHDDFINNKDIGTSLPRYDKMQRVFQGGFLRGVESFSVIQMVRQSFILALQIIKAPKLIVPRFRSRVRTLTANNIITCQPGIHAIDANQDMPDAQTIIDNNWYISAVNAGPANKPGAVSYFAQGKGGEVYYPFIIDRPIRFDRLFFDVWDSNELPNVLQMYA